MGKVTITYNGAVISEAEETAPVTVQYHGSTIATLAAGESKTLNCGGKYMRSDLIIGSKTLSCGGKKMASDISLAAEADSVEDDIITYTGTMTDQIVLMSNVAYRLLTLTSSGTLTLSKSRKADVWMCNGGNGGNRGSVRSGTGGSGGGGGYVYQERMQVSGSVVCTIGTGGGDSVAGGTTSFGAKKPAKQSSGPNGASGGGNGYGEETRGRGNGVSTMPFSGTPNEHSFLKYHSAGGGGGGIKRRYEDDDNPSYGIGGTGGSNGSNGIDSGSGAGGDYGGGTGEAFNSDEKDAFWYGSAGGGARIRMDVTDDGPEYSAASPGGSGYQGIIYIRIPLDQSIFN